MGAKGLRTSCVCVLGGWGGAHVNLDSSRQIYEMRNKAGLGSQ